MEVHEPTPAMAPNFDPQHPLLHVREEILRYLNSECLGGSERKRKGREEEGRKCDENEARNNFTRCK